MCQIESANHIKLLDSRISAFFNLLENHVHNSTLPVLFNILIYIGFGVFGKSERKVAYVPTRIEVYKILINQTINESGIFK